MGHTIVLWLGEQGGSRIQKAIVVLAVIVAALIYCAAATAGCGPTCKERVARERCSQAQPRWCVERAILTYRLKGSQAAWMRRIPGCESGWRPTVRHPGSGAGGLYQFIGSTWASTPYGRRDVFRAKWNALAAGWMVRVGRAPGEWVCR